MIPVTLKIEGFLSYRDPVMLDFTGIDLACISGPNGAGKSSLLDAITWALFGKARRHDESVINSHPGTEAAEVTLDFDYEGNRYRVMRTNPRGKTASVEFHIRAGKNGEGERWKPLTERTLRETNAKIEQTLRLDYETFINASFFLQGKADQFAVAPPAKRKEILSSILGLEIWESYREAAVQRRREKEKTIKALDGRLLEIQNELDQESDRKARLAELRADLEEIASQVKEQEEALKNAQRLQASLNEQRQLLGNLRTQLENASHSRDRTLETLAARREEKAAYDQVLANADAIQSAYQAWQTSRKQLETLEEVAAQYRQHQALQEEPRRAIAAEKARLTQEKAGLEEEQSALEEQLAQREALQRALAADQEKMNLAKAQLAERERLEAEREALQTQQAEAKAENPRLADEGKELGERIEKLSATEKATCPLCEQPLSPEDRETLLQALNADLATMRSRYQANLDILRNFESQLNQIGSQLADLQGAETTLRSAQRQADQLAHQLETLEKTERAWQEGGAVRLAEIRSALREETYAKEARQRLTEIDEELQALGYDLEAHDALRQAEQAGRQAEADHRALEQARAALAPIAREVAGLEAQLKQQEHDLTTLTAQHDEAAVRLAAAEADLPDVTQAETRLHDKREEENRKRLEVGSAQQLVNVLDTQKTRKAELEGEREALSQQVVDLKQLEGAFGKDGIPALLIDEALPELTRMTNDLLTRLSNGRMTLSFQTQREYKDAKREDLKETLDMVISDSAGERDYEMFSGGEAFRVNFSIRLALSKVLAQRAGARLQTLVIDEGFGSQDAQGRQRLVEAINLVRDDFEKILVITHLEELKDVFPTRIEVEKTERGSQVQII